MLLAKPDTCRPCPLYGDGTGWSQVEGSCANGVLVVLEALGRHEEADGLPVRPHADAGSVFQEAARLAGAERQAFCITNVCRCRPPNNELEDMPYEAEAIACCQPNLDAVVKAARPKVILAMGSIPLRTLTGMCGDKLGVTQVRGYVLHSDRYNLPVIATYHPSYIKRGAPNLMGVFLRDMKRALQFAQNGVPPAPKRDYLEYPTEREALEFERRVEADPDGLLSYDLETVDVVGEAEEDLEFGADKHITQIQFALAEGEGIALPGVAPFLDIAKRVMASPIRKINYNGWEFDDPILRAHAMPPAGPIEDLRWMFHHLYPDVPGKAHRGGLQYVGAFACPEFGPWKHLYGANLAWYGCADVDMPHRIHRWLQDEMRRVGVYESYRKFVVRVRPVLDRMSARGICLNMEARAKFYEEIRGIQREAFGAMQEMVPDALKRCEPKAGYANDKLALKTQERNHLDDGEKWDKRTFVVVPRARKGQEPGEAGPVERWVRVQPFKPSSDQLKAYMRFRRHPVPKKPGRDKKTGESKETADKLGLQRLYAKTRDPLYPKVLEYLEAQKIASTYIDGWECGADGKVHTTFTFRPATGQLSSMRPNVQNIPRRVNLAAPFRRMILASPGHTLVSFDYKSFHALTLGFEAQDAAYMRAARTDIHSIVCATQILKVESFDRLWALSDDDLMARLDWWKGNKDRTWETSDGPKPFKYVRDFRAKAAILGYGFGLQAKHLYEANVESFDSQAQAQQALDAIDAAFPRTKQFRSDIRSLAQARKFLLSKHGCIRWFWSVMTWDSKMGKYKPGPDAQKAIAFLPANDAFCHIKDAMLTIEQAGWAERYGLINQIHDDLTFDCPNDLVGECAENVKGEMERPSSVLVDAKVAPQGLACAVEVKAGPNLGEMREL